MMFFMFFFAATVLRRRRRRRQANEIDTTLENVAAKHLAFNVINEMKSTNKKSDEKEDDDEKSDEKVASQDSLEADIEACCGLLESCGNMASAASQQFTEAVQSFAPEELTCIPPPKAVL